MHAQYLAALMLASYASALPTMSPMARRAMLTHQPRAAVATEPIAHDLVARFMHAIGFAKPTTTFIKRSDVAEPTHGKARPIGIGRTLVTKPEGEAIYDDTVIPAAKLQRRQRGVPSTVEASQIAVADLDAHIKLVSASSASAAASASASTTESAGPLDAFPTVTMTLTLVPSLETQFAPTPSASSGASIASGSFSLPAPVATATHLVYVQADEDAELSASASTSGPALIASGNVWIAMPTTLSSSAPVASASAASDASFDVNPAASSSAIYYKRR